MARAAHNALQSRWRCTSITEHTYEGVMRAVRWGFTSVMFDGSALSIADNLKKTKEITRIAHSPRHISPKANWAMLVIVTM